MPAFDARPGPIDFNEQTFTVDRGTFDWADVDGLTAQDHGVRLRLYDGAAITLTHFGKAYERACAEMRAAWTDRLMKAMMLADLPHVETFRTPVAEIRVHEGGIAVIPDEAAPSHVRMADIDAVTFDEDAYAVVLETARGPLRFRHLAKRTDMFRRTIEETMSKLRAAADAALAEVAPAMVGKWREGRLAKDIAVPVAEALRPYVDHLKSLASGTHASYKRMYSTDEEIATPVAFSMYFVIGNLIAQEVVSEGGAATYWFTSKDLEALNAGLATLNFRREPIYLREDDARFAKYRPALRQVPELAAVRAAFVDRSIHRSPEEWKAQVDAVLTRSP